LKSQTKFEFIIYFFTSLVPTREAEALAKSHFMLFSFRSFIGWFSPPPRSRLWRAEESPWFAHSSFHAFSCELAKPPCYTHLFNARKIEKL